MILPVQRATNKDGWTHPMEMTLGYESFPVQHSRFGGMTEVIRRHLQGQALKKRS